MKRFVYSVLSLLMVVMLSSAMASAVPDLTGLNEEELRSLRDQISIELYARSLGEDQALSWDTSTAHLELTDVKIGKDKAGNNVIGLTFDYTNKTDVITNFRMANWVKLFHDGVEQGTASYLDDVIVNADTWGQDVLPGRTLHGMQWYFILSGTEKTVDVAIQDRSVSPALYSNFQTLEIPE